MPPPVGNWAWLIGRIMRNVYVGMLRRPQDYLSTASVLKAGATPPATAGRTCART